MSVVTISREFGSLGTLIAEKAARTLGYQLTDKNTIETIFKDYGLDQFEEEYQSIPGFWDRFDAQRKDRRENLITMLNRCLCAIARHGELVIVGRGGFAVLAGLADVLNVRIQAPPQVRMRRLVDAPAIGDPGRAEETVLRNDQFQKSFIHSVYGLDWDNARAFDLVLDTGKITPDLAADLIVQAARALKPARSSGERTTADLPADRILAEALEEVLKPVPG